MANAKDRPLTASNQSEAAQIAQRNYGGKVLKVERLTKKQPAEYRVKLLTDKGSVKIVTIKSNSRKRKGK
ncbi:PepSY domain-containing protein [Vibrio sp. WJH972]